jgi:competence ComEA-like helix-hairpin-helix protein
MAEQKINLNTADVGELTQLPGIAKNTAYKIVNHRARHGFFDTWEELKEVKGFPVARLDEIKGRAVLTSPVLGPGAPPPPRRVDTTHMGEVQKKPAGYSKSIRSTRRQDKLRA